MQSLSLDSASDVASSDHKFGYGFHAIDDMPELMKGQMLNKLYNELEMVRDAKPEGLAQLAKDQKAGMPQPVPAPTPTPAPEPVRIKRTEPTVQENPFMPQPTPDPYLEPRPNPFVPTEDPQETAYRNECVPALKQMRDDLLPLRQKTCNPTIKDYVDQTLTTLNLIVGPPMEEEDVDVLPVTIDTPKPVDRITKT